MTFKREERERAEKEEALKWEQEMKVYRKQCLLTQQKKEEERNRKKLEREAKRKEREAEIQVFI